MFVKKDKKDPINIYKKIKLSHLAEQLMRIVTDWEKKSSCLIFILNKIKFPQFSVSGLLIYTYILFISPEPLVQERS